MRQRARDHRPKIINFHNGLGGLDIAAQESILWPCNAFSVLIPVNRKRGLNIFEATILKLIAIKSGDAEQLTSITCLDKELVSFVLNRLMQLGLTSNRYEISPDGQELVGEWESATYGNQEYRVATVFVDLHSGKVLPYVHIPTISYEIIERIENSGTVVFSAGTAGNIRTIHAKKIECTKDCFWKKIPETRDIIKAIKEFKRRYKCYAILNKDIDRYPPSVPMATAISVQRAPELVFLHCSVLIQTGNPEIMVTDGCGFGFSENFASYLRTQVWPWLIKMKSKGVVDNIGGSNQDSISEFHNKAFKYPEISRRLKNIKTAKTKITNLNVNSSNAEWERRKQLESIVKNLYDALEWTLRQVVSENPVGEWEKIFVSQKYRDNEKLLFGFAEKVGLVLSEQNKAILQVKAGAIKQIEYGSVEVQPLLALALAGAISKPLHPMHFLIPQHSNFLSLTLKLKGLRDPIKHGNFQKVEVLLSELEELEKTTRRVIIAILPGVALDIRDTNVEPNELSHDFDQVRLKARVALDKFFSFPVMDMMGEALKEQLVKVESYMLEFSDDKQMEVITCLASAIQLALFVIIKEQKKYEDITPNAKEIALEKMVNLNFYRNTKEIPKSISTVNVTRIKRAAHGSPQETLGANLLAIFLVLPNDNLRNIKMLYPEFIDVVGHVLHLRQHGNRQLEEISNNDLMSLKNTVFGTVKILLEVI